MTRRPPPADRPPPTHRVPRADDPGPPPPPPRVDDVLTASEARLDLTRLADRVDHVDRDLVCVYLPTTRYVEHVTVALDLGGPTPADDEVRVEVDHALALELTPAEAVELARALLVLVYHRDRATDRAQLAEAFHRHRTGELRRHVVDELERDL